MANRYAVGNGIGDGGAAAQQDRQQAEDLPGERSW
jgi:hypothetical protein